MFDSITEILADVFGSIFDWIFDFIANFILSPDKIETQGGEIINHLCSIFDSFQFENAITFYFGFIWLIFAFHITFKALSIVRG